MTSLPLSQGAGTPRIKATIAAVGMTLLLSSCASFHGIGTDAKIRHSADYAAAQTLPGQGGEWPSADWAAQIGGAPLQALVDEALADNPNLQAAAARVAAARAAAENARASLYPTVGGQASATRNRFSEHGLYPPPYGGGWYTDSLVGLNFAYELDFWGKHEDELQAALSQGRAAQAEQYSARLMLAVSITRTWLQLGRQASQLELTQRQIALRERLGKLNELRFKAGLDTQSENEATRQQVASLRAEAAQWQEAIALSRNQLAALLGKGPDRGLSIPVPTLPADADTALPNALPLELLGRRPDIVASRWRVEAASSEIASARADFYPNVNLTAFAGLSSLDPSRLLTIASRQIGIGPALKLPIFAGGRLRAQLKGRVAGYENAVATYNQSLADALRDVADAVQSLRAAQTQGEQQRAATQAAANALKLARDRERAGTSNMLPVLANEMSLLSQQKVELDNRARRADLHVALIRALGGGFDAAAAGIAPDAQQNAVGQQRPQAQPNNSNTKNAS
ncbi:efflux transporter outer membrane subunit [Noviherbaspirillum pedocola]|uniref:Efflux transporter outer membrane subunit n=1 Tax=Noviherbaspirillum pedocola TaxID=2801341 RepID=A0A934SPJ7_9BURK|nr:efflux transporter outer membrane subunit [Noviherbaspirillum pedocola]MBK4733130.1 efflux transporter outer membrane subunit [Noviherbaspirillum pedocola]